MNFLTTVAIFLFFGSMLASPAAFAQQQPEIDSETLQKLESGGFETDPEVFKGIATGGQPNGRWKEGLTFM